MKSRERKQLINPWTWQDQFGFAQAVRTGGEMVLYCAGQGSVDAEGATIHEGDMAAQMMQCLDNLERVLVDANLTLSDVVRLNYYTTDIDGFFAAYRPWSNGCRLQAVVRQARFWE